MANRRDPRSAPSPTARSQAGVSEHPDFATTERRDRSERGHTTAFLRVHPDGVEFRRLPGRLWKPVFVLAFAVLSWGCGMSPDDARVQLGKLGYEFTPASYLTAVDRNDVAAVEYFILAGMEPDTTLSKDTFREMLDDDAMSMPLWEWVSRYYRPLGSFVEEYTFTALMVAAALGHTETVRVLLDAGADANRRDVRDRTALIWAIRGGHLETVEVLRGADAGFEDEDVGRTLNQVVANNDSVMLNFLLDIGVDSAVLNQATVTAFIQAVEENAVEIAAILIGTGVNVDAPGEDGDTPLIEAARSNRVEVVRMLLEAGADPNLQNDEGETALTLAARYGSAEIVQLLLDAGADLDAKDGRGATPLASSVQRTNAQAIVSTLLNAGANPNEPDANGVSPFMAAFESVRRRGIAEYLDLMMAMVEAGADTDFQDEDGDSPLMQELPVSGMVEERYRFWLDLAAGTEAINHRNKRGSTALILAARWGHVKAVRDLIGAGADLDMQNNRGHTALMSAAERQERQTAAVLVEAGANPTLTTPDGKTAADLVPYYAIRGYSSDPQLVSMLRTAASRWQAEGPKKQASTAPAATSNPQPSPSAGVPGDLTSETYLGGMKRRGMKVYALSKDGNWCSAKVVFRIRAPSADVYTDGTAEFYLKRFGERINESQFCPAARSADVYGYTDAGSEPVFTGKASAATGWAMN